MDFEPATPREAAAVILLDHTGNEMLWAKRNPKLRFLGGFHSFAGGKVDKEDKDTPVKNSPDPETATLIACAARETFEEIGVLLACNGERLTKGQFPLLHDDLISGRSTFAEILEHWGLWLDAKDFHFAGVWTTPEFSRIRFRTTFFAVRCPGKQIPYAAISELQDVEFVDAGSALTHWSRSEVLIAPPVIAALRALDESTKPVSRMDEFADICSEFAGAANDGPHFIELNSRLICFPVRTKTLPPATHTNCYISGRKKFVVIDAATPYADEQDKLYKFVAGLIEAGNECVAIIVSHLHPDHFGGEIALKTRLFERFGVDVPVAGHTVTIKSLEGKVSFDHETQDSYVLQDRDGVNFTLAVLHTPGHARGHLCFYDGEFGFLLSSDNVVGEGTVVIAPPEGNMRNYLQSLEEMKSLAGLRSLAGSHGAAVSDAKAKIEGYIGHRLDREKQIFDLVANGVSKGGSIIEEIYPNLNPKLIPLAALTVEAHLEKLVDDGVVSVNITHQIISSYQDSPDSEKQKS